MNFTEVQAAKMVRNNNQLRNLAGSDHKILLRRFTKPVIDNDFKEASRIQQTPTIEMVVLAKIRMLSENEMVSTEVGIVKKGDLFVMVDPDLIVTNLDEMRFLVDTQLENTNILHTWDYTIFDIKREDFANLAVGRTYLARRKMEPTKGGSNP